MTKKLLPILTGVALTLMLFISVSATELTTEKQITGTITIPEVTLPVEQITIDNKAIALMPPVITQQPQGITVTEGDPILLSVIAEGVGLEYQWGNAGYAVDGEKNSVNSKTVYANSNSAIFTLTEAADYSKHNNLIVFCEVSNKNGSVISDAAVITVNKKEEKPTLAPRVGFKAHPQSVTVNEGERIEFSVTTGGADLTYRWSVEIDGETHTYFDEEYNKSTFVLTENAQYDKHNGAVVSCYIFNEITDASSNAATVTVIKPDESKKPVIIKQPEDMEVYPGEYAMVSIRAENVTSYRIVIEYKDEKRIIEGEHDIDTPFVRDVCVFDPAIYQKHNGTRFTCTLTNEHGSVTSRTATVTVNYGAGGFIDVPKDVWFFEDVKKAVENGLINGISEELFAPWDNITIAQTIKLAACLHQLHNNGKVTLENGSVNWYDTYVKYAEDNEIICRDEYDEAYDGLATRADFVWIMYKALPSYSYSDPNPVSDNAIPDVPSDIGYAGPVYAFYRAGIITGNDSNGTFCPNNPIRRCEVAAVLTRMTDEASRKFIVLPLPELGQMKGPMCWNSASGEFVFFTEKEGKAAICYGAWESEASEGYIYKAKLENNILTVSVYFPPITDPNVPDSIKPEPDWDDFKIDITGLATEGKVKIQVSNGEWNQYYPAGPTLEDGNKEFFTS